jgi:hypothetical protein
MRNSRSSVGFKTPPPPHLTTAQKPHLPHLCHERCEFEVSASVLTTLLIEWYEAGELDGEVLDIIEENNNINKINIKSIQTKVGKVLKQLRFTPNPYKETGKPRQWRIPSDDLGKCIMSHGLGAKTGGVGGVERDSADEEEASTPPDTPPAPLPHRPHPRKQVGSVGKWGRWG